MSGLSLSGVSRHFPGARRPVLDRLDLQVPAGTCVALLGPSGSGKSTLLRLVAGLDTPGAGQISVDGRSLAGVPTERRRTALVFQRPRLFPHLDVLDNVAFPLTVAGVRRAQARRDAGRFLELVGLSDLGTRRTASLSGGQEQRVALARALAARPDVLLLDEPFSALDPGLRAEMHQLLGELRAAVEPTVLVVTHDRSEAAVLADTVAVLLEGRIAQHDTVDRLYTAPVDLSVHGFLGGRNAVPGTVREGVHHSALGALTLPHPTADGPGVLVARQESITLRRGPADPTGPAGHAGAGIVVVARALGARAEVHVDVAGQVVVVECGLPCPRLGQRLYVDIPGHARHVIPTGRTGPVLPQAASTPASSPAPAGR